MARQSTVIANGQEFEVQSVSPTWYFETNDRYGMTGDHKDTRGYMDAIFRNAVISPAAVASKGMRFFEDKDDIETPEKLIREIEKFFRPGAIGSTANIGSEG